MPKWISVVLLIIVFFAVAFTYESWRTKALEAWRRKHGFTPFVPAGRKPVLMAATQVTGRDGNMLRWASAFVGGSGETEVTFAEFEYTPTGRKTSAWFTLALWPGGSLPSPLVVHVPDGRNAVDRAIRAATGASVAVQGEPGVQKAWLTERRRRALDAWPHGGHFVLFDGYAGWITEGLLTPSRADRLLARLAEARSALD